MVQKLNINKVICLLRVVKCGDSRVDDYNPVVTAQVIKLEEHLAHGSRQFNC